MSLVNLLLLASLEGRFTYEELDFFLGAEDDMLEGENLVDKATRNVFALFYKVMELPAVEALSYF